MVEDLEQTKRRIFEEQQKLETQKTLAERAGEKIKEAISKIPQVTKEILFRGRGISGREEIRRIEEARRGFETRGEQVQQFQEQLKPFEEKLTSAEERIVEFERRKAAIIEAEKAFSKKISTKFVSGAAQPYLKQMYKSRQMSKIALAKQIKEYEEKGYEVTPENLDIPTLPQLEEIEQYGAPVFKEEEVRGLSPEELAKITVIPAGIRPSDITPEFKIRELPSGEISFEKIRAPKFEAPILPYTPRPTRFERIKEVTQEIIPTIRERVLKPTWTGFGRGVELAGEIKPIPSIGIGGLIEKRFLPGYVPPTYAEVGERWTRGLEALGRIGRKKAEELLFERLKLEEFKIAPEERVPLYQRATLVGEPGELVAPTEIIIPEREVRTGVGLIPPAIEFAPKTAAYLYPPTAVPTLVSEVAGGVAALGRAEEEALKEVSKSFDEYVREAEVKEGERLLTWDEYREEILPQQLEIQKQRALVEAAVPLAFLGGVGVARAYRGITKPIVEIKRAPPVSKFYEVQKPVFTPFGRIDLSTFKIVTKVPPVEAKVTTPIREFFGMKPKFDWTTITRPKKYIATPLGKPFGPGVVVGEAPYILQVGKIGRTGRLGRLRLYEVRGKQVPTTIKEFMELPAYERRILQRTIEAKKGIIIPEKMVPKFLREDESLVRGIIEARKVPFSIKADKFRVDVFTKRLIPGKRIERAEIVSILESKKIPRDIDVRLFRADVGVKPLPKVLPRAAGRVEVTPGEILELKPIYRGFDKAVKFIPKADIKKTPLEVTFAEQKQIIQPFIPPVPKPKLPKEVVKEIKRVPTPTPLPYMVGGPGLRTIPFAGEALYEVSEVEAVRLPSISLDVLVPKLKEPTKLKVDVIPKVEERLDLLPKLKVDVIPKMKLDIVPKLKERLGLVPKLKVKVKTKLVTRLKLKVKPKLKARVKARVVTKVKPKVRLRLLPPIIPLIPGKREPRVKKKKKPRFETGYIPYVIRGGKKVYIGRPQTREEALRKGKKKVLETAAVTFGVAKSEKKVPFKKDKPFVPGKEIRSYKLVKGKKVPLKNEFIQKRKARIKTPGEIREIPLKAKIKRRKSKLFK